MREFCNESFRHHQKTALSPHSVINVDCAGNRPTFFKRTRHRRASSPKFRSYFHVPI